MRQAYDLLFLLLTVPSTENRQEFDFIEGMYWVGESGLHIVTVRRFFVQIAPMQYILYSGDLAVIQEALVMNQGLLLYMHN